MEEKQLIWIGSSIVLLFTFLFLYNLTEKARDDTLFLQKVTAQNLALLHDAILSSAGDVTAEYSLDKDYSIMFTMKDGCEVKAYILDKEEKAGSAGSVAFCIKTEMDTSEGLSFTKPKKLIFSKQEGKFTISSEKSLTKL